VIYLLAFLFGLLIGSFLNVCIHRMPKDESVVRPGSRCPWCGHPIRWYDNVPLVSFLLLGGRCRDCLAAIPWRYPLIEALTGLLFVAIAARHGVTPAALKYAAFAALMLALAVIDLTDRLLPDPLTLGGAALGLGLSFVVPLPSGVAGFLLQVWGVRLPPVGVSVVESAAGAGLASGTLWLIAEAYFRVRLREGMGLGDVKMMALIGSFLGLAGAFWTLMLASVLGAVLGLLFIVLFRKGMAYELPFGTFLAAAGILMVVWWP
jgi:leader peptidase (prepilin peptidase)/N-methyltransferase